MSHGRETPTLEGAQIAIPAGHGWNRLGLVWGAVGAIGLLASLALSRSNPEQFYFSWLVSFMFFLSIALGGLFFVLIHHLTGARWSVVVRRTAENAMATLWGFAPLFIPVIFGMHDLFHWTHEDAVAHDALLAHKAGYLNTGFFLTRAALFFAIWIALSFFFLQRSRAQDRTADPAISARMRQVSAPAMFLFAITLTFASLDWMMSLDPHWYSTIYGVYYFAGSLVGMFAFMSIVTIAMRRAGLATEVVTLEHQQDLGKLLFAFTVFWAYIAFSQYFLIWYANIPEETTFYLHRMEGSWSSISLLLAVGHFVVPFFFLMSRHVKRSAVLLTLGSLWMLAMHFIDLHWLVMPTLHHDGFAPSLLDVTTFIGIGGAFLSLFFFSMRGHALIPVGDPRLGESLGFENV